MAKHPIRKGEDGGRFQRSKGYDRYLLQGKVNTGPSGGHFQGKGKKKRYLLSY